jgi:mono/diheme cytochrome c family protein
MSDLSKPDLEESVNVTEAHERVIRDAAAAARENRLKENGSEPVSLWVLVLCAVPLLAAGWTLGNAGKLFSYKDTVKDGYVRIIPADDDAAGPPPKEALAAYMAKGQKIYGKCIGCHGPDGKGDGNAYPSLAGSAWVTGETDRLAMVILNGLTGPTSTGKVYGVMPAQGAGMSGDDLATLMTYIRNSFGNKVGDVVTKQMGAAALEISNARPKVGTAVSSDELDANHKKNLAGDSLDPKVMLDPITLEPAEAK